MHLSHLAIATTVLSSALAAQWISPKSGAGAGNSNNNIPYSWWVTRYQQIHNHDSFTPAIPSMLIKGCNYRMANGYANGNYGGPTIEIEMYLAYGANGVDASTHNVKFDANVDLTTKRMVIKRKQFVTPKLANQNFDIKFPFDTAPFLFLAARQLALVKEVHMFGHSASMTNFTYPLDVWSGTASPECARLYAYTTTSVRGDYAQNGSFNGCPSSNNMVPEHGASWSFLPGSSGSFVWGKSKVANAPGLLVFGTTPLNVQLPGTSCYLTQDLAIILTGVADASADGYTEYVIPIPYVPALGGVKFLTQCWWVQAGPFPKNLYASRGITVTIGTSAAPEQMSDRVGASTGYGLITQFQQ